MIRGLFIALAMVGSFVVSDIADAHDRYPVRNAVHRTVCAAKCTAQRTADFVRSRPVARTVAYVHVNRPRVARRTMQRVFCR